MNEDVLECPLQTRRSYKVSSGGPVDIYYIPHDEYHPNKKFAFQIFTCWEPLLCSTAKCYTRVVCQSDVPVFVPQTADIFADGTDVTIYAPLTTKVRIDSEDDDTRIQIRPRSMDPPEKGVVVVYAADMKQFNEWVQVVVTDNMTVFCQGLNEISFSNEATATVYRVMKNCV
ncbi:hypothetical protein Q1695_003331 [Nippostrongylus brasiliensis]|nr:hypothetical protein Q1695_003331 [Nippostrongylus brasiliensis]